MAVADARHMERMGAFSAFDLDGSGAITQHDLSYAFQACPEIAQLVSDEDCVVAARRVGLTPGQLVTYPMFAAMCDVVVDMMRPKQEAAQMASALVERQQLEELGVCQTSPRRTTRSVPAAEWDTRGDDHEYLAGPAADYPPADLPSSPRGPRACLGDQPGMDPVGHAFYTFDLDFSGAVSGCELPRMLRLVPKRAGGTLARPGEQGRGGGDPKALRRAQAKWDDRIRECLAGLGKEYSDLLNIHDFQAVVDHLDPPPPPEPPKVEESGYETTESEKARREEEEEMRRRQEEARRDWEKMMAGTLVVRLEQGSLMKLLCCADADTVGHVIRRIAEQPGHAFTGRDPDNMRLIGRGFDMDRRNPLSHYGVTVGAPWSLVPGGPAGPAGGPFNWKSGDVLTCIDRTPAPQIQEYKVVSGYLQLRLWDGTVLPLLCEDDEPLEHVVRRLSAQVGVSPAQQRLVVLGRELNPRKTLRDYGVSLQNDVVDVLLRSTPAEPGRAGSLSPMVSPTAR